MKAIRQALRFIAWGLFIGGLAATSMLTLVVPALHALPTAMCDCSDLTQSILSTVQIVQLTGIGIGGVASLALWVVLRRTGRLKTPI